VQHSEWAGLSTRRNFVLTAVKLAFPFCVYGEFFFCRLFVPPGHCRRPLKVFQLFLRAVVALLDPRRACTPAHLFLCLVPLARHSCAFGLLAAVRGTPHCGFWYPPPKGSHPYRPPAWGCMHGLGRCRTAQQLPDERRSTTRIVTGVFGLCFCSVCYCHSPTPQKCPAV